MLRTLPSQCIWSLRNHTHQLVQQIKNKLVAPATSLQTMSTPALVSSLWNKNKFLCSPRLSSLLIPYIPRWPCSLIVLSYSWLVLILCPTISASCSALFQPSTCMCATHTRRLTRRVPVSCPLYKKFQEIFSAATRASVSLRFPELSCVTSSSPFCLCVSKK